jgi:hypothetical protein
MQCAEGTAGVWRKAPCTADWSDRMLQLRELAKVPTDEGIGFQEGMLSDAERRILESLGYLR